MTHFAIGLFEVQQLLAGQRAVGVVEARHLGAQLEGEIGVFAVGVEHQMARATARGQLNAGGLIRPQRAFGMPRVVAVDEHPVGAQVTDQQTLAVRTGLRRMHMGRALALGMHTAGLVRGDLRDRQGPAILGQRQDRQAAAGVGARTVVADEQVATVVTEAGMGGLVAEGDGLADGLVVALGVALPGADATDRVGMGRAVLMGGVKPVALVIQHQPGGIVAGEALHRLRVDLPGLGIEAQAQDAWAVAIVRVAADQNMHVVVLGLGALGQ